MYIKKYVYLIIRDLTNLVRKKFERLGQGFSVSLLVIGISTQIYENVLSENMSTLTRSPTGLKVTSKRDRKPNKREREKK